MVCRENVVYQNKMSHLVSAWLHQQPMKYQTRGIKQRWYNNTCKIRHSFAHGLGLANVCRDTFASLLLLLDRPKRSLRITRN